MKTFKQYFEEKWETSVSVSRYGRPREVDVFKNPSRKELLECSDWDGCAGILLGSDMYVWKNELHALVVEQLGFDNQEIIPLRIGLDGSNIVGVQVSDYSGRTKWHHNPDIYHAIINHPIIRLYGKGIDTDYFVSYYDEAINGPWHEDNGDTIDGNSYKNSK